MKTKHTRVRPQKATALGPLTESECLAVAARSDSPADKATAFVAAAILALRSDRDGCTLAEVVEHLESREGQIMWGLGYV